MPRNRCPACGRPIVVETEDRVPFRILDCLRCGALLQVVEEFPLALMEMDVDTSWSEEMESWDELASSRFA